MFLYSFIINGNKRFIKQKLRPFNHKTGHHCDDRLAVTSSYNSIILLRHYLRPVPERDLDFLFPADGYVVDQAAPKACVKLIYNAFLLFQRREEGS